MNTLILIFCSILLALIVGALFLPVLRGAYRGPHFFSTDGGHGNNLKLQRRILIENLRDIAIEKDGAKLNAEEFERLAAPLSRELERVEQELKQRGANIEEHAGRANAEHFCPVCGARETVHRETNGPAFCEQCGSEFAAVSRTS